MVCGNLVTYAENESLRNGFHRFCQATHIEVTSLADNWIYITGIALRLMKLTLSGAIVLGAPQVSKTLIGRAGATAATRSMCITALISQTYKSNDYCINTDSSVF